jgi:deoxycytidylate deaminase
VPAKPELVIGLVGPVGGDLASASKEIGKALAPYGYTVKEVRLSSLLVEVRGGEHLGRDEMPEDTRIERYMDAGDELRRQAGTDVVATLGMGYIYDYRRRKTSADSAEKVAFVLNSLKHPDEVETLRKTYGQRFILISVHTPTKERLASLAKRIAKSRGKPQSAKRFEVAATRLMERDERDETTDCGQNVRETFTLGDVYVSTSPATEMASGIGRYMALFFGHPFLTPTRAEYAMFQAHAAALRSADLSRQVGAVVATERGDIVAVGCNEVPRAFGGQYWPDDPSDERDFQLGYDSNAKAARDALERAYDALTATGQLAEKASLEDFISSLGGTRLANITEFGRPVHAEMAALLDAARRGSTVQDHELFTTTFPCHNCARHIIDAGIRRVVYREPYEKSLAAELHSDAVVVDPADEKLGDDRVVISRFVGVGPPRYFDLFTKPVRKDADGNRVEWSEAFASPRLVADDATAYLATEEEVVGDLKTAMANVDISRKGNQ